MKSKLLPALAFLAAVLIAKPALSENMLIGVAAPITGASAAIGAQIEHGASMAARDINAAGGIRGKKVVLDIVDDASEPKQAVSGANKLAGDGVRYVVAHFNSSAGLPAATVYDDNGMLAISPGVTNPQLTQAGYQLQFRVCGRDDQQGAFAADYIKKHIPDPKIAIIDDKTAYGTGIADMFRQRLNQLGIYEISHDGINIADKDFTALVAKIKKSGANTIYFGGMYGPASLLLRQLADQNVKVAFIGGDALMSNELAATAGDAVNHVMNTFSTDPRKIPGNEILVRKFRDNGFEPEAYTLYAYAVMQLFKLAIEHAGDDPEAVAAYLKEKGPFKTVLGDMAFDEKGDPKASHFVINRWYKAADGRYTYAEVNE